MLKKISLIFLLLLFSFQAHADEDFKLTLKASENIAILNFELAPGAKLYWLHPGEAGLATKINFKNSKNLDSAHVNWPVPEISNEYNLSSYVYKDKVEFPIEVEAKDINKVIELHVQIDFAICMQTCKNYNKKLILELKPTAQYIDKKDLLSISKDIELEVEKPNIELLNNKPTLKFEFSSKTPITNPKIFLNLPENINFSPSQVDIKSVGNYYKSYQVEVPISFQQENKQLDHFSFLLVADNAIKSNFTYIKETQNKNSLLLIIFYAIIGGFILNAMPCVLPIISIKVLNLYSLANSSYRLIRRELIAQSLGIIFCFIVIAIITYILKSFGKTIGFGFHFQQPIFIIIMIIILTIIATTQVTKTNFSLTLPNFISRFIPKQEKQLLDYFITGIFSTLLAIPCTAPFVTITVGFALSQELYLMLIIFTFLGFGMALPYLLMAVNPKILIKILPKPGKWMISFKKLIGIIIFSTCLWLLYVIYTQLGFRAALSLFLLCILIKFFLTEESLPGLLRKCCLIVVAVLCFIVPLNLNKQSKKYDDEIKSIWQEYDQAKINDLVKQGNIVIVNVTASWCTTCGINKLTTLNNLVVIDYLKKNKIYTFRADISNANIPEIEMLMNQFKHYGVPLDIVYSKKNPRGEVLPIILSPNIFIGAIKANK